MLRSEIIGNFQRLALNSKKKKNFKDIGKFLQSTKLIDSEMFSNTLRKFDKILILNNIF